MTPEQLGNKENPNINIDRSPWEEYVSILLKEKILICKNKD